MSLAAPPLKASRSSAVVRTKNVSPLPVVILIAAFSLACILLASRLNIWQDEAYSLHSSNGSIARAFYQGLHFEAQAPLYFVVLAAWRIINESATFARLLSVAFSVVTLLATWSFARSYVPRVNPLLVLAAVALNPFVVWAAVEVRPYAASLTFSALLLLLFFRGFVDEDSGAAPRILYFLLAILGTYTQYYVAFIVPANFVALLVLRRWTKARKLALYSVVLGLSLVPLVRVLPAQFASYHAFSVAYTIPSYVMASVLFGYPYPHDWIGSWAHERLLNVAYILFALVPLALAFRGRSSLGTTTKALLATVATLFVTCTAAIAVAHVQVIIPRHTLILLVPMLTACFALIGDVRPSRRKIVLASYVTIYFVFACLSLWRDFHTLTKQGDWHRVADFVAAHERVGDGIALFNAEAELPFRYYFKKTTDISAIPQAMSFDRFDEERFVLHDRDDVARSLGRFSARHDRIWLIETEACTTKYAFFGCNFLSSYVNDHFRELGATQFEGTRVLELQRRPNGSTER